VSDARCDLTDLPVDGCAHCTGRIGEPPPLDLVIVASLRAQYPGRCAACDEPFQEGDRISRVSGVGWVAGLLHAVRPPTSPARSSTCSGSRCVTAGHGTH
jgi:hypothetical protein